ncbi:hypothetical protein BJ912DRAFT_976333 [Pholiota molesta]|nr:hypothetical protein BJ912DRAFT_976333 [Pholiota molesta]
MSLPQEMQLEFILPKHSHALPGRTWIPIPPTEIKFEIVHSLWQYPGFLDAGRVKSALRMVLEDYPLWGARLAFVPLTDAAVDAEGLESGWRFDLNDTEGVQFSCVSTRHPGIFRPGYRDDDLNPDFYDEIELPSPHLQGVHPYPLMKIKLTYWELTGDTSITTSYCHALGDAYTTMRLMESWSKYYQGLSPTWKPTFEKYLTRSPATMNALPMDYVSTVIPYIGFLAVPTPWTITRIDLKFTSNSLHNISEMALKTSQWLGDGHKPSLTDSLAAYLIYILQKVSDTKIVQAQQLFGYRGMPTPAKTLDAYATLPFTTAGNCFLMVSSKERLDGTESVGKIASILRGTIAELREPELFQKTFAVLSRLYKRTADTLRFPLELPTEVAVQVNTISKLPALEGHFGYPGCVRMYHWDSFRNFFEIVPANPVRTASGRWITYDGGVDVCVRVRSDLAKKYVKTLVADMVAHGLGDAMAATGAKLQDSGSRL